MINHTSQIMLEGKVILKVSLDYDPEDLPRLRQTLASAYSELSEEDTMLVPVKLLENMVAQITKTE